MVSDENKMRTCKAIVFAYNNYYLPQCRFIIIIYQSFIHLAVHTPFYDSINPPSRLVIIPSKTIHLSVYLFTHLSIHPSIHTVHPSSYKPHTSLHHSTFNMHRLSDTVTHPSTHPSIYSSIVSSNQSSIIPCMTRITFSFISLEFLLSIHP